MKVYKVINIEEADYGCEECSLGARALVTLGDGGGPEKRIEMTEEYISLTGIDIGKNVVLCADGNYRPFVRVAAAIICAEENGVKKIFATRRGYGEYKGKWEFPGGKIECGETAEAAAVREIKEELAADIKIEELFFTVEYDYPQFHLSMDCFLSKITGGKPTLTEHEAAAWLTKEQLDTVDWLPADRSLIERLSGVL